jgi:hypothetical protein
VAVRLTFADGTTAELGRSDLLAPIEKSLRYFVCATSAVAVAMVLAAR